MRRETIGINDSYRGVPIEQKGVPATDTMPRYYKGVPVPSEYLIGRKKVTKAVEIKPKTPVKKGKKC